MPLTVELVTAEKVVQVEDDIDVVIVPGSEGQLAILPSHAPLMTTLDVGELVFRNRDKETSFAVSGGFLEVRNDKVTVLANAAETGDEIDITRAEEARTRAEERLRGAAEQSESGIEMARARAALQRALLRLRVADKRGSRPRSARPGG